jgi:hypothetical protein
MTLIDRMIDYFREGENLYLESRTEMAEYTDKERQKFYDKSQILKEKGAKIYDKLVKKIGIDAEYLDELLRNEGI